MARDHAEIYLDIWSDPNWLKLSAAAKSMYFLLLSQRKLDYAGVIYLNVMRWAALSPDTTEDDVCVALHELEEHRFIVIDESTNEVLIRSFFRRDVARVGKNGGKNANLIRAALNDANKVDSVLIRAVLVREIYRCVPFPIEVSELVRRFPDLENPPVEEGVGEGDAEGVPEGVQEPLRDPVAEGVRSKEQGVRSKEHGVGVRNSEPGVWSRRTHPSEIEAADPWATQNAREAASDALHAKYRDQFEGSP